MSGGEFLQAVGTSNPAWRMQRRGRVHFARHRRKISSHPRGLRVGTVLRQASRKGGPRAPLPAHAMTAADLRNFAGAVNEVVVACDAAYLNIAAPQPHRCRVRKHPLPNYPDCGAWLACAVAPSSQQRPAETAIVPDHLSPVIPLRTVCRSLQNPARNACGQLKGAGSLITPPSLSSAAAVRIGDLPIRLGHGDKD